MKYLATLALALATLVYERAAALRIVFKHGCLATNHSVLNIIIMLSQFCIEDSGTQKDER